jgi:hypothetical protein
MHLIEPFYRWQSHYLTEEDERSPFYGQMPNLEEYENTIYGYYIHPEWNYIGSETLYVKVLFADYDRGLAIIEFIGEWNDTLHNDIMHLKRNVIDVFIAQGIKYFILIGENVLNFHGLEDDYYSEWMEEVEDGWIASLHFREFVQDEMAKFGLDMYVLMGGPLDEIPWRTFEPLALFDQVDRLVMRRLGQ